VKSSILFDISYLFSAKIINDRFPENIG